MISLVSSKITKNLNLDSFTSFWKNHNYFLLTLFSLLLIWSFVGNAIYSFLDGPDLKFTQNAYRYATNMAYRFIIFLYCLLAFKLIVSVHKHGLKQSLVSIRTYLKANPDYISRTIIMFGAGIVTFGVLQANFMSIKTAIPSMQPFYLDSWAMEVDRILFLGKAPWTYFSWVYDIPMLFKIIDLNYSLWAILIAGTWTYAFIGRSIPQERRYQYVFSMLLMWLIGGNVLATILSSAGPCYYEHFTGTAGDYAPLMANLARMSEIITVNAVEYQSTLLWMHENPTTRLGGISAIPSLHVGTSLLLMMFLWKNKILRALMIVFNILIYCGSIILGWHYGIDGIIVIPVALFCWYLGGIIGRKVTTKTTQKA